METTITLGILLWFGVSTSAFGAGVRIANVEEFIKFKDDVYRGIHYYRTTVFLDSDLDFSGKTF